MVSYTGILSLSGAGSERDAHLYAEKIKPAPPNGEGLYREVAMTGWALAASCRYKGATNGVQLRLQAVNIGGLNGLEMNLEPHDRPVG